MDTLERHGLCRDTVAAPPLWTRDRPLVWLSRTLVHRGANQPTPRMRVACMTEYQIAASAMIILWTNLVLMPTEIVFNVIEAELERCGIELASSR
jgi:hypothetical protein